MNYFIKYFVMASGERYCVLMDKRSFEPLFYPNLYITTQVRNKSLSLEAMKSSLAAIAVFMEFLSVIQVSQEELEVRIRTLRFFSNHEYDLLREFCQRKFSIGKANDFTGRRQGVSVAKHTTYIRMTEIGNYLVWLVRILLQSHNEKIYFEQLRNLEVSIKARRPKTRGRTQLKEKGLTVDQYQFLLEILRPESEINPFVDEGARYRNRLMVLLLHYLGIRGGELLNLRIKDVDFQKNHIVIARRADETEDCRLYQPLVKTVDRRLPITEMLSREIHQYITKFRRKSKNGQQHDYLFITHKKGPTEGQPVSISSYKKMFSILRGVSPLLDGLSGHKLRHSWNERFSQQLDSMDSSPSESEQEKMRSYLMGWKEGSGTSAIYNRRFIKRKSEKAAVALQKGMLRVPEGIHHD